MTKNQYSKDKEKLQELFKKMFNYTHDLAEVIEMFIHEKIEFQDDKYIYFKRLDDGINRLFHVRKVHKWDKVIHKLVILKIVEKINSIEISNYKGRCKYLYRLNKTIYNLSLDFYHKYLKPFWIGEYDPKKGLDKWIINLK